MLKQNSIKKISIFLITLLTVAYCGSIDFSCCSFNAGGSINGSGTIDISRSLLASLPAAVHEDNGRSSEHDHNLEELNIASDILVRIARKLAKAIGYSALSESINYLRYYLSSLCICSFAIPKYKTIFTRIQISRIQGISCRLDSSNGTSRLLVAI